MNPPARVVKVRMETTLTLATIPPDRDHAGHRLMVRIEGHQGEQFGTESQWPNPDQAMAAGLSVLDQIAARYGIVPRIEELQT